MPARPDKQESKMARKHTRSAKWAARLLRIAMAITLSGDLANRAAAAEFKPPQLDGNRQPASSAAASPVSVASSPAAAAPQSAAESVSRRRSEEVLNSVLRYKPVAAIAGDDELHRLLIERYDAALSALHEYQQLFVAGVGGVSDVCASARIVCDAQLALVETPDEQLQVLRQYVAFAKSVEKDTKIGITAPALAPAWSAQARELRLDAEIRLLRLQVALAKAGKHSEKK
jgi:hypothetical protein